MKPAFSLIELIFSIVIIAIAFMSIPTLMMQAQRSDEFSIYQEAILATSTKIKNILSYRWDENSINSDNLVRVLDVSDGDIRFYRNETIDGNKSRTGHFAYTKRRSFFTDLTLPTGAKDGYDDIDDFDSETNTLIGVSFAADDYKKNITLNTSVYYVDDTDLSKFSKEDAGHATNIKMIEVKSTVDDIEIILRAFSTNIGERELMFRSFD